MNNDMILINHYTKQIVLYDAINECMLIQYRKL